MAISKAERVLGSVYVGATDCNPTTCHCGRRLHRPKHGYVEIGTSAIARKYGFATKEASKIGECWHIVCECNARYVWSWDSETEGDRNGRWYVYPLWPMQARKPLPDNGKRYIALANEVPSDPTTTRGGA